MLTAGRVASLEDSRQQVQAKGGTMQGEGLTDQLIRHAKVATSNNARSDQAYNILATARAMSGRVGKDSHSNSHQTFGVCSSRSCPA